MCLCGSICKLSFFDNRNQFFKFLQYILLFFLYIFSFTFFLYSKIKTIYIIHYFLIVCYLKFNKSFVGNSSEITNIYRGKPREFRYLAINPTESRTEANISLYQHKPFRFFIIICRCLRSSLGNGFAGISDIPH